jgi:ribosomal protein S1
MQQHEMMRHIIDATNRRVGQRKLLKLFVLQVPKSHGTISEETNNTTHRKGEGDTRRERNRENGHSAVGEHAHARQFARLVEQVHTTLHLSHSESDANADESIERRVAYRFGDKVLSIDEATYRIAHSRHVRARRTTAHRT